MDHDEWLERISAEVDGELDPAASARLAEHLEQCASCARLLAELDATRRRLRVRPPSSAQRLVPTIVDQRRRQRDEELAAATKARTALLRRCTAAALASAAAVTALVVVTTGSRTAERPVEPLDRADALIAAHDHSFDRADIEVRAGTTVEWRNAGSHVHHLVREFDGVTIGEDLPPGRTETATFDRAGTFSYYCTIHPEMVGTVTVDA